MSAVPDLPMPPELALPIGEEPFGEWDLANYLDMEDHTDEELGARLDEHPIARWRIEADDQAEWAGRHLAEAREEIARLEAQANEWAERIGHWFEQASKRHLQSERFFSERLSDYGLRVREAGGPSSIALPSVTVATALHKPAVKVEDDESLARLMRHRFQEEWDETFTTERAAAWLDALAAIDFDFDDLVKITPKVYVGPLRKLVHVEEISEEVWDFEAILECGHKMTGGPVSEPDDFAVPERGDYVDCAECKGHARLVSATVSTQRKRLAAVGPDGVEVPGCTVSEASVTATVKIR